VQTLFQAHYSDHPLSFGLYRYLLATSRYLRATSRYLPSIPTSCVVLRTVCGVCVGWSWCWCRSWFGRGGPFGVGRSGDGIVRCQSGVSMARIGSESRVRGGICSSSSALSLRHRITCSPPIACTPAVPAATRIAMKPVILSFAHPPLPFFSLTTSSLSLSLFSLHLFPPTYCLR
jgi:hypothetical protein